MQLDRLLNARSDDLARAQAHLERHPEIRPFAVQFDHLPLIVDTNRVLQDVAWLAKRHKPDARTSLQELCASRFVTLYAPEQLIDEVEAHLTELAENVRVPRERVETAWASYVELIKVIPTEHLDLPQGDSETRDPSDLPFLAAQRAVGAHGILSKDKDLAAMGALIVKHEVLRFAVEFARNRSVVVHGTVLGTGSVVLTGAVVYGAFKGAAAVFRAYRRLPERLQVLLAAGAIGTAAVAVFHGPTRARLCEFVKRAKPRSSDLRARGGELLDRYLSEVQEADRKAQAALTAIREHVPLPSRKPTLKQLAYRVCLESKVPLTPAHIENRVRLQGYQSKANDIQRYLRAVLRSDSRLVSTDAGWSLTRRAVPSGPIVETSSPGV